jgi:hypothetical protein
MSSPIPIAHRDLSGHAEENAPRAQEIEDLLLKLTAESSDILGLQDDSGDFVPYSRETLNRAIDFLRRHMKFAVRFGLEIPFPKLLPGPTGSIDVHWKNEKKELLVNIPVDPKAPSLFYGDDYGKSSIKGSLDTASVQLPVLTWFLGS